MGFQIENGVLKKYEEENGVTEVLIPENVTEIGEFAFCGCSSLTSITIPDNVRKIGYGAFGKCSSLTTITIPEGALTALREVKKNLQTDGYNQKKYEDVSRKRGASFLYEQ